MTYGVKDDVSYALIKGGGTIQKYIRVNERIRAPQIRVIGAEGEQFGVMTPQKAMELANQSGLDLVEVAAQSKPPVCRIMDFSKYKYDQEKKERQMRKRQAKTQLKEIRVKPHIDEHDYQVKLRHASEFLQKKHKVKINLFFRGREMAHQELGKRILDKFINDTATVGQLEKGPMLEGRIMSLILAPK